MLRSSYVRTILLATLFLQFFDEFDALFSWIEVSMKGQYPKFFS